MRKREFLRYALVFGGIAGSLGFGAAQALASPRAAVVQQACWTQSNPDQYCYTQCRLRGARTGVCDYEDGGCICTL